MNFVTKIHQYMEGHPKPTALTNKQGPAEPVAIPSEKQCV